METDVKGSAMPVDIFIDFAQDYANNNYGHEEIRRIFSVGREVSITDLGDLLRNRNN